MSNKQKNNYPLEFKTSAVKLAIESDQPVAVTARDLGVNPNSLYNWVNKYSNSYKNNNIHFNETNQNNPNSNKFKKNNMRNQENSLAEIKQLKKELAMVKQERDLLKKAAAYFAKESQ